MQMDPEQANVVNPGSAPQPSGKGPRKKPIVIAVLLLLVLIGLIVAAVLLASNGSDQPATSNNGDEAEPEAQSLEPAAAIDVENASNSITQDISELNVDEDFPNNQLSGDSLGL